jgi:hypothetical protein
MESIATLEGEHREAALVALEAEMRARTPDALFEYVAPLPCVTHIWSCFWDLDGDRPIIFLPAGLGVMIPIRGPLPSREVGAWMDERQIFDPQERHEIRQLLKPMDAEYQRHQHGQMPSAPTATAGETEGVDG